MVFPGVWDQGSDLIWSLSKEFLREIRLESCYFGWGLRRDRTTSPFLPGISCRRNKILPSAELRALYPLRRSSCAHKLQQFRNTARTMTATTRTALNYAVNEIFQVLITAPKILMKGRRLTFEIRTFPLEKSHQIAHEIFADGFLCRFIYCAFTKLWMIVPTLCGNCSLTRKWGHIEINSATKSDREHHIF